MSRDFGINDFPYRTIFTPHKGELKKLAYDINLSLDNPPFLKLGKSSDMFILVTFKGLYFKPCGNGPLSGGGPNLFPGSFMLPLLPLNHLNVLLC